MTISRIARTCSNALGSSKAFISAVVLILVWALSGPFAHFSETWQLIVNTATTVLTFLFLFLLQHSQNMDTKAIHLKLDEILKNDERFDDRFIRVEQRELQEMSALDQLHEEDQYGTEGVEK